MSRFLFWLPAAALIAGCTGAEHRANVEAWRRAAEMRGRSPDAAEPADPAVPEPFVLNLSQDESPTLADYRAYALLRNAGLRAAFEEWKAALERAPQAWTLPDPTFTFSHFVRRVETEMGPQRRMVAIMQAFPWLGTLLARRDLADVEAEAARARYEAARAELLARVTRAYAAYAYMTRERDLSQEHVDLLTRMEAVTRARFAAGQVSHGDVVRAQLELGERENVLDCCNLERPARSAALAAALDLPESELLPWPEPWEPAPLDDDDAARAALLARHNPELARLQAEREAARARQRLADQAPIPDVMIGADWMFSTGSGAPNGGMTGRELELSLSFSLPLWWGKYAAARREARAERSAAELRLLEAGHRLEAARHQAVYEIRIAERTASLYRDTLLPKAHEAFNVTDAAYRAGTADFTALIDTQRRLLQFQLAFERARADLLEAHADLEALLGAGEG